MIVNCPNCSGPILKTKNDDAEFGSVELDLKCPHCRKTLELQIRREVVVFVNGIRIERLGETKMRML